MKATIAALYSARETDLERVSDGFQNTVYQLTHHGTTRFVRVTPSSRRDLNQIRGELDWLLYLAEHGANIARPLPAASGQLIEEVTTPEGTFFIASFEQAAGRFIDVNNLDEWKPQLFETWGETIGTIHRLTEDYVPQDPAIRRPAWSRHDPSLQAIEDYFAEHDPAIAEKCRSLLQAISQLPITEDTYGLIHNDFHQGNLFLDQGRLTVFDFDDARYGWLAYDLAAAFYHAYWQGTSSHPARTDFAEEFMRHFLTGYRRVRVLPRATLNQMPLFLKWREMFLYHLFSTCWDPGNLLDWQAYTMKDLRHRILHDIPYTRLDFQTL